MTKRKKACAVLAGILALSGCGGGGNERPPIADVTVGGIWHGTIDIEGQGVVGLSAFVTEIGAAHFIQDDGVQYWGTLVTSQRELSGTLSSAAALGETFPDGAASATGSISGSIIPYGFIGATLTLTTAAGAAISGEISLDFDPLYGRSLSVENIAGTFTDASAPGSDSLTIDTSGVIFGQVPSTSCVLNGQLRRVNPPYNVYGIQITYSSCAGDSSVLNGARFSGLATLDFLSPAMTLVAGLEGTASGVPVSILIVYERT